ncbi:HAD family hydrolase [bacterium]|nr:HAD family hydrolase [bacterium]MCB2179141.1 HAD family hydrolase [bacterium]
MALNFEKIQALCFDVDGTLVDTDEHYVARLSRILGPVYKLAPRRDVNKAARRITMMLDTPMNLVYTLLDWMHLDAPLMALLEKVQLREMRKVKPPHPLIPGTQEALDLLKPHFPLSVVTARGQGATDKFLNYHQLTAYFVCIAHGQTTRHTKPWPDPVLWAAEKMGISPENCLMIGDTTVDIRAGKAAGAQTVGVLSGFGDAKELSRAGADLVVEDVYSLTEILLQGLPKSN